MLIGNFLLLNLVKKLALVVSRPGLCVGFAAALLVVGVDPAVAQGAAAGVEVRRESAVTVVLTQLKVVRDGRGGEQLIDAGTVKPGDVVEYKATYTNKTGKAVVGLVADLPIPEGFEYLPSSAKPGGSLVRAATKDGMFGAEPLMRKAAGNQTEPVPYVDYRSLRWNLGQLPANGSAAVTARVKVEGVVPPAPLPLPAAPAAPR